MGSSLTVRSRDPNLGIDLEDIKMDRDFFAKEEADAEERGEKEAEVEEGKKGG